MWHISKEQLILFPLVPFLHHVCHAWPSTLQLKVTMSFFTFCKFCEFDKSVIAKQCNGVAAEIVTSLGRWSFPFWKFEQEGACNFSLWSWGSFGRIWDELKGKFPQTTMWIEWVEGNFTNPTVKVWADLDNPLKRSDYAKLCMSPSLDVTLPVYVKSQEDNSPLTLYIDFQNF